MEVTCPNYYQGDNKAVSSVDGKESIFVTEKVFDVFGKYLPPLCLAYNNDKIPLSSLSKNIISI